MLGLLIFLIVFLSLLGYFFFAPLYIEANTMSGLLRVRFHRLASVRAFIEGGNIGLEIQVMWWQKKIIFGETKKVIGTEKKEKTQGAKHISLKRVLKVLGSFRINKCFVTIDTGDFGLNGILYPAVWWFGAKTGRSISINFWGDEEVIIEIENNIARMAWAYATA